MCRIFSLLGILIPPLAVELERLCLSFCAGHGGRSGVVLWVAAIS